MFDTEYDDDIESALQAQAMINSLEAWKLEGSVGRHMMSFIEAGQCCLGFDRTRDAWGNLIPGRDDVQPGTMGSLGFVAERFGQDFADQIAAVPYKSLLEVL